MQNNTEMAMYKTISRLCQKNMLKMQNMGFKISYEEYALPTLLMNTNLPTPVRHCKSPI